jgi:hypothetical protein
VFEQEFNEFKSQQASSKHIKRSHYEKGTHQGRREGGPIRQETNCSVEAKHTCVETTSSVGGVVSDMVTESCSCARWTQNKLGNKGGNRKVTNAQVLQGFDRGLTVFGCELALSLSQTERNAQPEESEWQREKARFRFAALSCSHSR